ncbi:MAG: polyhydroxyalkanoate depolymerase [Variovorax sp.]|nr:polyhydroxyalkanoate depolymerase [Variovorax sp.]
MLYHLYEAQRSLMEPFTDFAQVASKLYSKSVSPFAQLPIAQRVAAGYDLIYRLGKDYVKPEFGISSVAVDGVDVVIHEHVELDKPFCQLRRFKRFTDQPATLQALKQQPAVLIVAPLSGHYATLLRDTVKTMLQGHKVYITDWKNARMVPTSEGSFHLDDYIHYVEDFIRHLQELYGNCHVVSVCQPTVPVLAAISLMASRGEKTPLSMTMMGGPIDARKSPTVVNNLATNKSFEWFENNVIYPVPKNFPGAGRRVYPGFLQHTGFVAMNPDRHASSHYDYFKNLIKGDDASAEAHRKFYDEYNAVLDMDADYYLDTIRIVFQDFLLMQGIWDVKASDGTLERVKPQDITATALLTVEGELDDISGSAQTQAAHELCTGIPANLHEHLEVEGAGHYGIFSGRRWRDAVYPKVRAFIAAHDLPQQGKVDLVSAVTAEDAAIEPDAISQVVKFRATKPAKVAKVAKTRTVVEPKAKAVKPVKERAAKSPAPQAADLTLETPPAAKTAAGKKAAKAIRNADVPDATGPRSAKRVAKRTAKPRHVEAVSASQMLDATPSTHRQAPAAEATAAAPVEASASRPAIVEPASQQPDAAAGKERATKAPANAASQTKPEHVAAESNPLADNDNAHSSSAKSRRQEPLEEVPADTAADPQPASFEAAVAPQRAVA